MHEKMNCQPQVLMRPQADRGKAADYRRSAAPCSLPLLIPTLIFGRPYRQLQPLSLLAPPQMLMEALKEAAPFSSREFLVTLMGS
jgi:hypothetical protein